MVKFINNVKLLERDSLLESFLKNEEADCVLYSKEGVKFNIHKEIFFQTKYMRNILLSVQSTCCRKMEIFCPCSEDELECIVNFFYSGKISCNIDQDLLSEILYDLKEIFGFCDRLSFIEDRDGVLNKSSTGAIIALTIEVKLELLFDSPVITLLLVSIVIDFLP